MEIIKHGRKTYDMLYFGCPFCGCWYKEIYAKCDGLKCKCPECGTMVDGIDEEAYKFYLELVGSRYFRSDENEQEKED